MYQNPILMNRIILPPNLLSFLASYQTDTESSRNYLYLLRDSYRPRKITISNLYELLFGQKQEAKKEENTEGPLKAEESYFSSYE